MALTSEILNKIKAIMAKTDTAQPADIEYTHAESYLQALLENTPEKVEPNLIRFFRIRPKQCNKTLSAITEVYQL